MQQLTYDFYLTAEQPGFEPATFESQVQVQRLTTTVPLHQQVTRRNRERQVYIQELCDTGTHENNMYTCIQVYRCTYRCSFFRRCRRPHRSPCGRHRQTPRRYIGRCRTGSSRRACSTTLYERPQHDHNVLSRSTLTIFIHLKAALTPKFRSYESVTKRNALFDALHQLSGTHYRKLFSVETLLQFLSLG